VGAGSIKLILAKVIVSSAHQVSIKVISVATHPVFCVKLGNINQKQVQKSVFSVNWAGFKISLEVRLLVLSV
jgi:hypothetical protein